MAVNIPLATSASSAINLGLPEKRCHNVYMEPDETDPNRRLALVETPGSIKRNTFAGACRGMWQADGFASGKVLVAQGTTLSTFTPSSNTASSITGTIAGSDRGDLSFTETEGFGLFNGGLYVSDGSSIAAVTDTSFADLLSDAGVSAFTSVSTLGQRGLFTFGPRFGFTEVLDMDNTTALSYYTAESSPDDLIAGRVLGELYYLFGTQTIEVWAQTGSSDDPFAIQPGMTIQVGCLCRDGIIKTDNSIMFVDADRNVRRLGLGNAEIISEPWVVRLLKLSAASDIIGFTYMDEGHIFAGWRTPYGTAVYDVLASQIAGKPMWHTRGTNLTDTWRYTHMVKGAGRLFACDATGQFDELSRDYTSESMADADTMGTEIVREFTAFLGLPDFSSVPPVALKGAKGIGTATGQGSDPIIRMRMSFDRGATWTSFRDRKLGAQGEYSTATIWRMNGSAKRDGVVFHFLKSDPAKMVYKALEPVSA